MDRLRPSWTAFKLMDSASSRSIPVMDPRMGLARPLFESHPNYWRTDTFDLSQGMQALSLVVIDGVAAGSAAS